MMFCPKCGSIMMPKPGSKTIECKCGHKVDGAAGFTIKETSKKKARDVEVIEDKEVLPKTKNECKKCKHDMAYHWEVQTRAGDEAPTRFYKCEKCKHTWREYS